MTYILCQTAHVAVIAPCCNYQCVESTDCTDVTDHASDGMAIEHPTSYTSDQRHAVQYHGFTA